MMSNDQHLPGKRNRGLVVLYDGMCPVCRRSAEVIRSNDLLGVIVLKKYQDFTVENLPVPVYRLNKRIQACNTNLENCREGIFALSSILIRIPQMFLPAVFTYLAGLTGIGQRFYDFISENRYNLPFSGLSRIFIIKSGKRKDTRN